MSGGWKTTHISSKSNGKRFYFYQNEDLVPFNMKEPISSDKKCVPLQYCPPLYERVENFEENVHHNPRNKSRNFSLSSMSFYHRHRSQTPLHPAVWNNWLPEVPENMCQSRQSIYRETSLENLIQM
jgi:hypothetical protein